MKRILWALTFCFLATSLFAQSRFAAEVKPAQSGGELRLCIFSEPLTFNPLLAEDVSSETVRYLTAGVLLRVDRVTQKAEPGLATSWKVLDGGKRIHFSLRTGLRFSDGTPFSASDVAYTVQQLMDPALHSATGDAFRSSGGKVITRVISPTEIDITFSTPVAGLADLFDTVGILSAQSPQKEMAVLGPFYVAEHKSGAHLVLKRNPYYWKKDAAGRQLPYLDSVRLDIQANDEIQALRYSRGEIHMINKVAPGVFDKLAGNGVSVQDAGVTTDTEQIWFNQVPTAPIPDYKRAWFASTNFRRAVSEAINRADVARIAFHQHASPAVGVVSPANKFWFNAKLQPHPYDPASALRRLQADGFHMDNGVLRDKGGHEVEFSIIGKAGDAARQQTAALIQQDLKKIGIKANIVPMDMPAVIERITTTFNYEACILGLTNVTLDPNAQMNVWLSSADTHQWNPQQKSPATAWEAEIDRLMLLLASSADDNKRKQYWDRVQQIAWEQEPFIYLVNKHALVAIAPAVKNGQPSALFPQTFWNVEQLSLTH
jgi:peptide/nickel transport system substrate-binding protein